MENASKALIMAAGVLIGVLLLSLAVYLFMDFGAKSAEIRNQIESNQLTQFNAQFNVYEGRKDITIYQIISLVNLAKENNEKHKDDGVFETDYRIQIFLGNNDLTSEIVSEEDKLQYITENNEVEGTKDENGVDEVKPKVTYECTKVEYYRNTTRKNFRSPF